MSVRATVVLALAAPAVAFTPRGAGRPAPTSTRVEAGSRAPAPSMESLNGWVPDESAFAWGLPGTLSPVPDFDPAGFAADASLDDMKRYREAEVTHGRVSMLAFVGFLTAESFHPLFGGDIGGPAIRHLDAVREVVPNFFETLVFVIALAETTRALVGWTPPGGVGTVPDEGVLRDDYYPGDIGFDPLGLKPADPEAYAEMQTKELQHGRLAMLAAAGFIAQELVNETPILANLSL